jgi:hypothetical protein
VRSSSLGQFTSRTQRHLPSNRGALPTRRRHDRPALVHHAEAIALKGDSYRLKNRDLGRVPADVTEENSNPRVQLSTDDCGQFSAAVDIAFLDTAGTDSTSARLTG